MTLADLKSSKTDNGSLYSRCLMLFLSFLLTKQRCIPYRLAKGNEDATSGNMEDKIEVCMVSSPNRDDLVFPKGGWEDDETVIEAACREAVEEAGVKGILNENPLGVWEFRSKSKQDICSLEGGCRGYMFALEVTEELEAWPEQENRYRKWLTISEAFELCRYEWMRMALKEFLRLMTEDQKIEVKLETSKEEGEVVVEEEEEEEEEVVVVELPSINVSDVADCQIVSPKCYVKSSTGSPHHDLTPLGAFSWLFPLKRLSLK